MSAFTDEELLAYADERLAVDQCSTVEQQLRGDATLVRRLADLLSCRDQGDHSVGELWRRDRLSCPPRAVWSAYLDGRLGDGLSQYLQFHVETIGCRICIANLSDLQQHGDLENAERRTRKIFQSSAGRLSKS
jgi:hypothetical protein